MATFQIHDDFTTASEIKKPPIRKSKGRRKSIMKKRHSISSIHHSAGISKKKSRRNKRVSFGGNRIREFNEDHTVEFPIPLSNKMNQENRNPNRAPASSSIEKLGKPSDPSPRARTPIIRKGRALKPITPPPSKRTKKNSPAPGSASSCGSPGEEEFYSPRELDDNIKLTEEELAMIQKFDIAYDADAANRTPGKVPVSPVGETKEITEEIPEEIEGEDMDTGEKTMEITANIGEILAAAATEESPADGPEERNILGFNFAPEGADEQVDATETSMDMTKNVGTILTATVPAELEAKVESTLPAEEPINISQDSGMDLTNNFGKILNAEDAFEKQEDEHAHEPLNESNASSMELTKNVGVILKAGKPEEEKAPENEKPNTVELSDPSGTLNFTKPIDKSLEVSETLNISPPTEKSNNATVEKPIEADSLNVSQSSGMELTRNVGKILSVSVATEKGSPEKDSLNLSAASDGSAMDMTKNVGAILAANPSEAPPVNVAAEMKDITVTMEMTQNFGEILTAEEPAVALPAEKSMTMEVTENVGDILEAIPTTPAAADAKPEDQDEMEMTENVGEIIAKKVEDTKEVENQEDHREEDFTGVLSATMDMEITENVGKILSKQEAGEVTMNLRKRAQKEYAESADAKAMDALEAELNLGEVTMDMTKNISEVVSLPQPAEHPANQSKESAESTKTVRPIRKPNASPSDNTPPDNMQKEYLKIMHGDQEEKTANLPRPEKFGETTRNMDKMIAKMLNGEPLSDDDEPSIEIIEAPEMDFKTPQNTEDLKMVKAATTPNPQPSPIAPADIQQEPSKASFVQDSKQIVGEVMEIAETGNPALEEFFQLVGVRFPRVPKRRPSSFGAGAKWPPHTLTEMIEFSVTGLVSELKERWIADISETISTLRWSLEHAEGLLELNLLPSLVEGLKRAPEATREAVSEQLKSAHKALRLEAAREFVEYEHKQHKMMLDIIHNNRNALVSDRVRISEIASDLDSATLSLSDNSRSLSVSLTDLEVLKLEVESQAKYLKEVFADLNTKKEKVKALKTELKDIKNKSETQKQVAVDAKEKKEKKRKIDLEHISTRSSLEVLEGVCGISVVSNVMDNKATTEAVEIDIRGLARLIIETTNAKVSRASLEPIVFGDAETNDDEIGANRLRNQILDALVTNSDTKALFNEIVSDLEAAASPSEIRERLKELSVYTGRFVDFANEAQMLYSTNMMTMRVKTPKGAKAYLQVIANSAENRAQICLDFMLAPGYPSELEVRPFIVAKGINAHKHGFTSEEAVLSFVKKHQGYRQFSRMCLAVRNQLAL